jgi:hypothetical protein
MTAMAQVPKDSPLMKAWERYKASDEYENTRRWALHDKHVDGSLWAAFVEGWNSRPREDQLEAALETVVERLDNLLHAAKLPLRPQIHFEGLVGGLTSVLGEARLALGEREREGGER